MNNQLTVWYKGDNLEQLQNEIKGSIKQEYGFSETEFEPIENGFEFIFDDETNGEIEITFIVEKDAVKVTVAGTWSWEVIEVYNRHLPDWAREDVDK